MSTHQLPKRSASASPITKKKRKRLTNYQEPIGVCATGNPFPIAELLPGVRERLTPEKWHQLAYMAERVQSACPGFADGWGLVYLLELMADGEIGTSQIDKMLADWRVALALQSAGKTKPMSNPGAYFAGIVKRHLRALGLPWSIKEYRRRRAS